MRRQHEICSCTNIHSFIINRRRTIILIWRPPARNSNSVGSLKISATSTRRWPLDFLRPRAGDCGSLHIENEACKIEGGRGCTYWPRERQCGVPLPPMNFQNESELCDLIFAGEWQRSSQNVFSPLLHSFTSETLIVSASEPLDNMIIVVYTTISDEVQSDWCV